MNIKNIVSASDILFYSIFMPIASGVFILFLLISINKLINQKRNQKSDLDLLRNGTLTFAYLVKVERYKYRVIGGAVGNNDRYNIARIRYTLTYYYITKQGELKRGFFKREYDLSHAPKFETGDKIALVYFNNKSEILKEYTRVFPTRINTY